MYVCVFVRGMSQARRFAGTSVQKKKQIKEANCQTKILGGQNWKTGQEIEMKIGSQVELCVSVCRVRKGQGPKANDSVHGN